MDLTAGEALAKDEIAGDARALLPRDLDLVPADAVRPFLPEIRDLEPFLKRNLQIIVFAQSRLTTEILTTYLKDDFDDVPGYPTGYRILVNAQSERSRLAITLGLPLEIGTWELMDEWERRMDESQPVPPMVVEDGPVMENVLEGDEVDLFRFPTPLWHPQDGGRYLGTGDCVITRDPEGSWINVGTYRVMVHDRDHTGLYISPGKHGRLHRDKYFARGEPMPVLAIVGMDPLLFLASCLEIPLGVNEYEWAGAVKRGPVAVVRGRHTGLPMPAGEFSAGS